MKRLIFLFSICLCSVSFGNESLVRLDLTDGEIMVNPLLFSSFSEMHSGDLIPGIYEQYVVNPSLEEWYKDAKEEKSDQFFRNIPDYPGVAYPWEALHLWGDARFEASSDCMNTVRSQKITLYPNDEVILFQKIALPFYRVKTYKLTFYAKGDGGKVKIKAGLKDSSGKKGPRSNVFKLGDLGRDWTKYEVILKASKSSQLHVKRYNIYLLAFEISGSGSVLIDQVNLIPTDCVEGIYNPETLAYFKEYKVAGIRWPGGNYTSCYHWKNGIGDPDKRPSTPNKAWNGVDPNCLGTDEFMRFCELAGITPIMGVGYGEVTKEEIVDWVEYCNGGLDTPMGALRAANGHPEPYNVRYWGVGNEVYGSYQIGHTTAEDYSAGMVDIIKAMKEVDPGIKVIASAYGVHNHYRKADPWNRTVMEKLAPYVDLMDAHDYTYGPRDQAFKGRSKEDIFRTYIALDELFGNYVTDFRALAGDTGIKLASLEWGVLTSHIPRSSFANMLCSAVQLNEMVRQADICQLAAMHNFSFYVQPHYNHVEPVNVRTLLFKEFSKMGSGRLMEMRASGMPYYQVPLKAKELARKTPVPEVDAVAVENNGEIHVSLVNRSVSEDMSILIRAGRAASVSGNTYTSTDPFSGRSWALNRGLEPTLGATKASVNADGDVLVTIPPMSFTMLTIVRK